jgi:hypothetical protein
MSIAPSLPARAARIPDETTAQILRLAIRQVPATEIAKRAGVHRHTVRRVLKRTRAALAINEDLSADRAEAIAVYREVQRTAWEAVEKAQEKGRSPAALLGEVRQSQARIDGLLGLAPADPDDPMLLLAQFKQKVITLIHEEAPELAPRLTQRLLDSADARNGYHAISQEAAQSLVE